MNRRAAKDATPTARRLAYYASQLPGKETWYQEPATGYRLYKDVPICRTGSQQYLGRELKKNPGYRDEWNLGDDEMVTVYRPVEEVTHPATIASHEAKSVLDEHPPDPQILVDAIDEYDGVSMGHGQNVRVGAVLPDGETPLIADLWVKHPELNIKIDGGVRDISCGYTFRLDKDSDGRYIQREIRGNHIAVVPVGRAGKFVGIGDAAPEPESKGTITMSKLIALGLHAAAKDAKPDEFVALVDEALANAKTQGAKDADEIARKAAEKEDATRDKGKGGKDADKDDDKDGTKDADHNMETCEVKDCAKCAAAKDDAKLDDDEFGDDEMTDADMDGTKDDEGNAAVIPAGERGETDWPLSMTGQGVGDSVAFLKLIKPVIARSKDKGLKDAYKKECGRIKAIRQGVKDGAIEDPFKSLTRINAAGGVDDAEADIPAFKFFEGKSHADGLKAYNDYLTARQTR